MAGPDGHGLQKSDVLAAPCIVDLGDDTIGWAGDAVVVIFDATTLRATSLSIYTGCIGELKAKSPDDLHAYAIPVSPTQIRKDGAPLTIPTGWIDAPEFSAVIDELHRALVHTYAPTTTLPPDGETCLADKTCIVGTAGDIAYFYVRALGYALWVDNRNAAQPVPSIPTRFDLAYVP